MLAERRILTRFNRAVILSFEKGPYLPTQKRLNKLSLMANEKKILQDLEHNPNFCDSVIDIFTEKINCCIEL
jgi:hypothetical protein